MPFHRGAVAKAIPHSDLNLKTSILTKMFLFLEKDLYLDAIGLHLKKMDSHGSTVGPVGGLRPHFLIGFTVPSGKR